MEDSNSCDGVTAICEQLDNAIGYIEPATYQRDLPYVWTSLDDRACPGVDGEGTNAGKADGGESAFDPGGVFTAEAVYNLKRTEIREGTQASDERKQTRVHVRSVECQRNGEDPGS